MQSTRTGGDPDSLLPDPELVAELESLMWGSVPSTTEEGGLDKVSKLGREEVLEVDTLVLMGPNSTPAGVAAGEWVGGDAQSAAMSRWLSKANKCERASTRAALSKVMVGLEPAE